MPRLFLDSFPVRLCKLPENLVHIPLVLTAGMQNLIERADSNNLEKARERPEATPNGQRKSGAAAKACTTQR